MAKILVADDAFEIRKMLRIALKHQVVAAKDGVTALESATQHHPDLILMDVRMPGMDGFETCRRLRADPELTHIPVIFTTSCYTLADKLKGFDVGADDYVVKPFDLVELELRIQAVLRRAGCRQIQETALQAGALRLDLLNRKVDTPAGSAVLTQTEFSLLTYMMQHPGALLSTRKLLEAVWDYPPGVGDAALVRAHIHSLRTKLEQDPSRPRYIQTVGRQGYVVRG